jgi:hypothetical protein
MESEEATTSPESSRTRIWLPSARECDQYKDGRNEQAAEHYPPRRCPIQSPVSFS